MTRVITELKLAVKYAEQHVSELEQKIGLYKSTININRQAILKKEKQFEADLLKVKFTKDFIKTVEFSQLEYLVWSTSTKKLSKLLHVSDTTITKYCEKLDVIKPPKGYWNKVHSGKLPHPLGIYTDKVT